MGIYFRTAQCNTFDERQCYWAVSHLPFRREKGPMCFLCVTPLSPESTSHVKQMCKYHPKKAAFFTCCLAAEVAALSPFPSLVQSATFTSGTDYIPQQWTTAENTEHKPPPVKISFDIKFTSYFHSNMPGERSHIFCFVRKTHTSCFDFYAKFALSSWFSKKSEFLCLCHWHPKNQTSSKPKSWKPQPRGVMLQSKSKRNPSLELLLWMSSLIRLWRMNSVGDDTFCWFI